MLFRYHLRNPGADMGEAELLAREWGVTPAVANVLIGRGVATAEAGRAFFNAGLETLRDPMGFWGMAEAVERIGRAVAGGERIVVYGDYDVDGVCATAILAGYLAGCGAHCEYYIPSRHTEGYGLNAAAVDSFAGAGLLITVDCGVTNAAEVSRARALGMDVIVTDHHECPECLPDCTAVINPKRPGQGYGFTGLCGAGVVLKLVQALGGQEAVQQVLDLAALATVADIVPLTDENRAIVRLGLESINRGQRPGIRALREVAGLGEKPVKAGNIAFALAPRINAGGRMDLSRKSVELLLSVDPAVARAIAQDLDEDNAARVKVEEAILAEAVEMVEGGYSFTRQRAIVLYRPHWNTGVTGIVASRIVERYHRPTLLFGDGESACYGSGRSVPGVHLHRALKECAQFFLRFGGHEQAAGCALAQENLQGFADALDEYLARAYDEDVFLPLRNYDGELALKDLTPALAGDMDRLEPCGFGNPRPVFLLQGVELAGLAKTADGKHLRMRFGGPGGVEGIAFRQGGAFEALQGCHACDALVVPDLNDWMGRQRVQAVVEHIRPLQGLDHARSQLARAGAEMGRALALALRCEGGGGQADRMCRAEGLAAFAGAVQHSCWGTMGLCFTAEGAAEALRALELDGCLERVYVGVGQASQAARRENALVIAPDIARVPVEGYDNVFVFDGVLAEDCARLVALRLNHGAKCIIIDEDADWPGGQFSREELLRVYRAMKRALKNSTGPSDRADWGWLERAEGVPGWRAELSARIFVELGLLLELDRSPWLKPVESAAKAELGDSAIYRRLAARNTEVRQ